MAMDLWRDPFREILTLRDMMDRMYQDPMMRPISGLGTAGIASFPIDVAETDDGYVVHAALPGITPDQVQIEAKGNTITIRGEATQAAEQKLQNNQHYLTHERRNERFYRAITLPDEINADKAQAQFENGILTLSLPRAEESKPKRIQIGNTTQLPTPVPGANSKTSQEFGLGLGDQAIAEADQSAMGTDTSDKLAQPNR